MESALIEIGEGRTQDCGGMRRSSARLGLVPGPHPGLSECGMAFLSIVVAIVCLSWIWHVVACGQVPKGILLGIRPLAYDMEMWRAAGRPAVRVWMVRERDEESSPKWDGPQGEMATILPDSGRGSEMGPCRRGRRGRGGQRGPEGGGGGSGL